MMNHAKIRVREVDLLKLVLDFLTSRNFNVSMRTLEKESGVVNCPFTEDILFLRELILDGDWDEVLLFAQPFEGLREFDSKQFKYLILKQKFLELLSLKFHIVGKQAPNSIEDVMKTLNLLEETCPTKEEYSNLCWLLTVPNLNERNEFKDWTLDNSRLKCFTAVLEVIRKVPSLHKQLKQNRSIASSDRLLQLVVKGLFYETCIEYCQSKATRTDSMESNSLSVRTNVLHGIADDYSANLLSWVRSLGHDVFSQPFEQVSVEIVLEKLARFEKNLRHSVDVPKKIKKENYDENVIYRSLSSLDPAISHKSKPQEAHSKPSPLLKDVSTKDEIRVFNKNIKETLVDNCNEKFNQPMDPIKLEDKGSHLKGTKDDGTRIKEKMTDADAMLASYHSENHNHQKVQLKKTEGQDLNGHENISHDSFEAKDDEGNCKDVDARLELDTKHANANQIKESVEEDLNEVEEKKRRESVMKKLEEYENRKKLMQMQLQQLSQGLGVSDSAAKSSKPDAIKATPSQVSDAPSHRQYVSAKDLVADFDKGSKHSKAELGSEVNLHNQIEERDSYGYEKPIMRDRELKQPENVVADHAASHRGEQITPEKEPNNARKKEESLTSPKHATPLTTPKNSGFFVNLSDGSGKMSTSTPKPKRQSVKETPPPEASPVKTLDGSQNTPKAVPKKALQKQILSNRGKKTIKVENKEEQIEINRGEQNDDGIIEAGKENASKDSNYSRKGPVINGVRRTLVSPHQHLIQPPPDAEARQIENAKPLKPKPDGDVAKETISTEAKPLAKGPDQVPVNKGPGPKIKTRDGSKVLVTELLKSREEIKNATANKQRFESPEIEEKVAAPSNIKDVEFDDSESRLQFSPVCLLEDSQAIRAVCFHPDGKLFAVGSNSKILRVCTVKTYQPVVSSEEEAIPPPSIVFKRNKYHKGSIYCMTWNPLGDIIATGSNDKSIKLLHFDPDNCVQESAETELNIHNGTVRELSFVPDKPAILVSGGAGDGGVQITDCATCQTIGTLRGHTGNVMAVYAGEGDIIATGSTDNTLRLWDLRSHRCIDVILVGDSSPASVALSSNGSYLASGQEDGCILLYDISAGRTLQSFRLHQEDCRSVRFSPDSKYLLTGSYDTDVSLLHTEGDLELTVPLHYKVAGHKDKVIQSRWHPNRYSFLSSSADRTAVVWSTSVNRNLLFS